MRSLRMTIARLIVGLGLLVAAPVAVRAQRAAPSGVQALAVPTRVDAPVGPPPTLRLERDERIALGVVVGAAAGAMVAYFITHNREGTVGGDTSDAHELDFMVYMVAVPVGALLGALFGSTSGGS